MADPPVFRAEQTGNPQIDRIQRTLADTIAALKGIPFLWGKRVDNITVVTTVTVRHGLGRRMSGYLVLRSYGGGGEVPLDNGPGPDPLNEQIFVAGVSACTVDLWFF